jgi:hypothetical protein
MTAPSSFSDGATMEQNGLLHHVERYRKNDGANVAPSVFPDGALMEQTEHLAGQSSTAVRTVSAHPHNQRVH